MKTIVFLIALFSSTFAYSQYDIVTPDFIAYVDISMSGVALNLDDDEEANITVPFDVYLGEEMSNMLRIGNNGAIIWGDTGDLDHVNTNLSTDIPMIAPFWDDFDSELGNVYYQTIGTTPDRYLLIQWDRVHYDGSQNVDIATFQVGFSESNKQIYFNYFDLDMDGTAWDFGASATIGIATSTDVSQFSFNTPNSSLLGLQFLPKTYVPDDNFEAFLEDKGYGNGLPNDNYVSTTEISYVYALFINDLNINDLTGIEGFTTLNYLDCRGNNISDIDMSNSPPLVGLVCKDNHIYNLNISNNTNLVELNCTNNDLDLLDVSHNPNLELLICDENNLSSIDISNIGNLAEFSCSNNQIESLDISNNSFIGYLTCNDNQISQLDLGASSGVIQLECMRNKLAQLDLSQSPSLSILRCNENNLTELDISSCPNINEIYCYDNNLNSLNIANGNNQNIDYLWAYTNPNLDCVIVDDPSNVPPTGAEWKFEGAISFSTDCEPVTYVPDPDFEAYLEANGMGNGIANDQNVSTNAIITRTILSIPNLNIGDLTGIEGFSNLKGLYCEENLLTSLDLSHNLHLEQVFCENNQIASIDINSPVLVGLICYSNSINNLNISLSTKLKRLECYDNNLVDIDISHNTELTHLFCSLNDIQTLDLGSNTKLVEIDCSFNQIYNLIVSNNSQLELLSCHDNQLNNINISNIESLYRLDCYANQLLELNTQNNQNIVVLNCFNNQISSLDLTKLNKLAYLECQNNQLVSLNIANANNSNIEKMYAYDNPNLTCIIVDDENISPPSGQDWQIDDLASYANDCLSETYIPDDNFEAFLEANDMGNGIDNDDYVSTNKIINITTLDIENKEIADLTGIGDFAKLYSLNCMSNIISSIDLSKNQDLAVLWISNNQLSEIDVSHNSKLNNFICNGNQLSELDFSHSPALGLLRCEDNNISTLDLSQNDILHYLSCDNNNIQTLVLQNPQINFLQCRNNNLIFLDVTNGNNTHFDVFATYGNPDLYCIQVDDPDWSEEHWTNIDDQTSFAEICHVSTNDKYKLDIQILPNPISNQLYIEGHTLIQQAEIYDITGQQILVKKIDKAEQTINLSSLSSGLYMLKLVAGTKTGIYQIMVE